MSALDWLWACFLTGLLGVIAWRAHVAIRVADALRAEAERVGRFAAAGLIEQGVADQLARHLLARAHEVSP